MPFLEQLGMQAAGGATDGIMGIALGAYNDYRQVKQARKLQKLQMEGQREMTDYNMMKQLEMWEKTGYGAQMEQMKRAGLNPALMYGMGGGGGQTANVDTGNVQGQTAPSGGGEAMGMMGMGIQRRMMEAQVKLLEVEARKKEAEIPQVGATTENIKQQTTNAKTLNAIQEVDYHLKDLEKQYQSRSLENRLTHMNYLVSKLNDEISILSVDKEIKQSTKDDEIKRIKAEAVGAVLNNVLTEAKTDEARASIKKMAGDLINATHGLDIQERELELKKWVETVKANFPSIMNVVGRGLNDIIESITKLGTGSERQPAYEPPKSK